jgi:DNA-binding CsgD family transcriptional regulator
VLLTAAAAGRPTAEVVAAAHGRREQALEALELAAAEGVVVLDGDRIRFAHPLLASVCYGEAPTWRRRSAHRALSGAVADVEERARHLALAADAPEARVAAELEAAEEHASARGATAAAAELSELTGELTPPGEAAEHRRRRSQAAWYHRFAGNFERACTLWEELLAEFPGGVEHADVLYALATTGRADLPTRVRLCEEAAQEATDHDGRAAQILGFLAISRWLSGDVSRALDDARAGLERAERLGDPGLLATALGRVGLIEMWALEMTPGLLERGVEIEQHLQRPLLFHDSPGFIFALRLALHDELDRAREMLDAVEQDATARGDEHTRQWAVLLLIQLDWYAGFWRRALDRAVAGIELAEQTQELQYRGMIGHNKALVEVDLGLVDEARASVEDALACSEASSDAIYTNLNRAVLGRIELARGNAELVAGHLRDLPLRILATGDRQPGRSDVWADTIETLILIGELDQARTYLDTYLGLARLASHRAVASATRCRGLLAAAQGEPASAVEAFERALAELGELPYPLERGRTLLALGSVHRQAKQKRAAREALDAALAVFQELGAALWAEKACAELRRISGRRATGDLTETEQRIAALAAEGRSNREIAAALFVSVRTVEAHLYRIYRKLGVRSRSALAARLAKVQ